MVEEAYDQPCDRLNETIEKARDYPGGVIKLMLDTRIPDHWLKRFMAGTVKAPSYNRVEFLRDFFGLNS